MSNCYVGKKKCGCYVFAAVADGHHQDEVLQAIRDGLEVSLVPTEKARQLLASCPHKKRQQEPEQLELSS